MRLSRGNDNSTFWLIVIAIAVAIWLLNSGRIPSPLPPGPPPPIPLTGLRVLILEETDDRLDGPTQVLLSTRVREAMNAKCAKFKNHPEWRMYDDDLPAELVAKDEKHWQEAYELAKKESNGKLPWVLISAPPKGFSGPLPKTEDEFLALIAKYGGA